MKKTLSLVLSALIIVLCAAPAFAASDGSETVITLSDSGIQVNGSDASASSDSDVYVGADIVYYEAGHDSSYGEGTSSDEHTAEEAQAHTVVTITKAGTYRVTGTLSAGQIAIDLGEGASSDPTAVVTLILDGADITCTVAPAVIFYNVYECGSADTATASATVDTSSAGANVIIADGSVNNINGSYVARIYKEGTVKKLHKYDGAFYSKMSMNVTGGTLGTGVLNITAKNEGLDSELHLTINGGVINITSQDDGINTNEDGVSVTTINGGTLYINGGFGSEGDGIDSNGYLVINGGTIIATANPQTGDGGIDADMDILINGGTVIALGSRNDAAGNSSAQAFIELSYGATQSASSLIRLEDENGGEIVTFAPTRNYQSVTISTSALKLGTTYHLYSGGTVSGAEAVNGLYASGGVYTGGTQQQYTGTGAMGGMGGGMIPPDGTEGGAPPFGDGTQPTPPEGGALPSDDGTQRPERPDGTGEMPGGFDPNQSGAAGEGSVDFTLTAETHSFTGISDSADASGKTAVRFTVNGGAGMTNVSTGGTVTLSGITAALKSDGSAVSIPESDIQITITDVPSESYAKYCLLSDGADALSAILPTDDGTYQLTISVLSGNETYTGTSQWRFTIGALPFNDVTPDSVYYEAIEFVYDAGLMLGVGNNSFSPDTTSSRAMAITVLARLAEAEGEESGNFSDVEAGSWYSPYVGWAQTKNIVNGYGNGLFGPNDTITREQMCLILYNYSKTAGISLETSALTYTDASRVSIWAYEAVEACAASGVLDQLTAGGSALNPSGALTRAELADMLMRFVKLA